MTEIQAYFHSLFTYNPETGDLVWKKRTDSSRSSMVFNGRFVGKIAGPIVTSKNSKNMPSKLKTPNGTLRNAKRQPM